MVKTSVWKDPCKDSNALKCYVIHVCTYISYLVVNCLQLSFHIFSMSDIFSWILTSTTHG